MWASFLDLLDEAPELAVPFSARRLLLGPHEQPVLILLFSGLAVAQLL